MSWLRELKARILALFRGGAMDRERAEEMRYHLEEAVRRNLDRGMPAEEARRRALLSFGGIENVKEMCRDERGTRLIEDLMRDLRFGIRTLTGSRKITVIAILVLALGIGSTVTVYSVIDAALMRALPFPDPERLVQVNELKLFDGKLLSIGGISVSNLLTYRDGNPALLGLAQYNLQVFKILGVGQPDFLKGAAVTANFFDLLQVRPLSGRTFSPAEEQPGSPPVVILSYELWQSRFASRKDALGEAIRLGDTNYTIIGIAPSTFSFPSGDRRFWGLSLFVPLHVKEQLPNRAFLTIARLRPGVDIGQAQSVMGSMVRGSGRTQGSTQGVQLRSLRELTVANLRTTLLALMGAVGLVLLIACVNVANLLLARLTQRQKEFAVRMALGAGVGRLARQLLIEALLLGLMGGIVGLLLSASAIQVLKNLRPADLPQFERVGLNVGVVGFALCLSLATGLLFGIMPLRGVLRLGIQDALKANVPSLPKTNRLWSLNFLIISEVSLAMILLTGAGLLMNSFMRLQNVRLGFERDKLLTGSLSLEPPRYSSRVQWEGFYLKLLAELQAIPGVQKAALASGLPLREDASGTGLTFDEEPPGLSEIDNTIPGYRTPDGTFATYLVRVTPGYFQTLGFHLVAGRFPDEQNPEHSQPELVISQTMARHLWPDSSAVGKRTWLANRNCEIVGVVEDVRYNDLKSDFFPVVYVPFRWQPVPDMTFVIRTYADPASLASAVRRRVAMLDKEIPVVLRTMDQQYASELATPRFYMLVFGLFGFLATAIAAGGVYGVISYTVSRRTHEIGVRMALGAQTRDVLGLVLGLGMTPAAIGIALGLAGAAVVTRFISSLLFGVVPTDPATFASLAALMAAIAMAACYIPARRAAQVNPIQVIRCE